MLAAVRRAFASAAPLDPSSAPRLAPRALGELVRPGALFPSGVVVVARRSASGGRAGVAAASYKGPFATAHPSKEETMRFAARHLAVISGGDGAADAGAHGKGGGGSGLHLRALRYLVAALAAAEVALWASSQASAPAAEEQTVSNWSGTQHVNCARHVQPESVDALAKAVEWAHTHRRRLRPVGSALSPNGAAFNAEGMISLALLDELVRVDRHAMTVTTQAGARVLELVEKLRPHGLTLANYASIREQQIGGFTQVGAHGTGARIPPLDETVTSLALVTPGKGVVRLSEDDEDPETFRMARCSVGSLGVATEVTLRCVPAHRLLERTWTATHKEVEKNHDTWLKEHQHLSLIHI